MTLDRSSLTARNGFFEGEAATVGPDLGTLVTAYKQQVCRRYLSLNPDQIDQRLGGTDYVVTRKYDGELAVICFEGDEVFTVNTGGRVRLGLELHAEALARLRAAGLTAAVVPAELYVAQDAGRTRVFDVAAALADPARHASLRLAPFDIVSLDGEPYASAGYAETHARLSSIFSGPLVTPVQAEAAASRQQVAELYRAWVGGEGAEGLVVRSELPIVYKVKPTYTLDVAVIGYSENPDIAGQVRSLLVAFATEDGRYQPVGHVGSGLTDATRADFHTRLSPLEVASSYIETDANHVAFHLVRPELVIEVKVNDVLFESTSGPILNALLEFDGSWTRTGTAAGVSIIHPVLERVRDDKAAAGADVRLAQIEQHWSWPLPIGATDTAERPASRILRREVFTKTVGGKLMVQKFLVWQTNKSAYGYAEYVLAYTNFSSGRADPLSSEVRISEHAEQVLAMADALIADKVKSGWQPVVADA